MTQEKEQRGTMTDFGPKIADWLNTQGYPLEMEVAKTFRSDGFDTTQSAYYVDAESGESREMDVVAQKASNIGGILLRSSIVVECKKTDDKPWVLLSTGHDGLPPATSVSQRVSSLGGDKALSVLMNYGEVAQSPLFKMGDCCGYALARALADAKDNSDPAYKALMAVSSAARSMALYSDKLDKDRKVVGVNPQYAHVVFPVLVISGSLWRGSLNESTHKIDVTQLACGTLVWRNRLHRHHHTIVHIVTREYLASFVNGAAETWRQVKAVSEGPAREAIAAIPQLFNPVRRRRRSGVIGV